MWCMLSTSHVSSRLVANISKTSFSNSSLSSLLEENITRKVRSLSFVLFFKIVLFYGFSSYSADIPIICLLDAFCLSVCLRLSQFSQLSFIQYMGLCTALRWHSCNDDNNPVTFMLRNCCYKKVEIIWLPFWCWQHILDTCVLLIVSGQTLKKKLF